MKYKIGDKVLLKMDEEYWYRLYRMIKPWKYAGTVARIIKLNAKDEEYVFICYDGVVVCCGTTTNTNADNWIEKLIEIKMPEYLKNDN